MKKKWIAVVLAAALAAGFTGCDTNNGVGIPVVSVATLNGKGDAAVTDRYAGVVVSENTTKIERDSSRTVGKLYAEEGKEIAAGDVLFTYDVEMQRLDLDKKKLELEKMQTDNKSVASQITQLKKERDKASKDNKLQYDIEIQSLEAQQRENDYNIKLKQREITQSEATVANADVLSPVSGKVVAIHEDGTDEQGNPQPYITIQENGAYRVKGTINELNRQALNVGSSVKILSRTDGNKTWTGTISAIDMENPIQSNDNLYISVEGGKSDLTSSSSYPFYVELDSSEELLLGQHVYITLNLGVSDLMSGVWIPSFYVCFEVLDGGKDENSGEDLYRSQAYVWAANEHGKLEKRSVVLGDQDPATGCYEIQSGITMEDYIASPDDTCKIGAKVDFDRPKDAMNPAGDNSGDLSGVTPGGDDVTPNVDGMPDGDIAEPSYADGAIQPEVGGEGDLDGADWMGVDTPLDQQPTFPEEG